MSENRHRKVISILESFNSLLNYRVSFHKDQPDFGSTITDHDIKVLSAVFHSAGEELLNQIRKKEDIDDNNKH
jgi:hypothetical protein